MVNVSEAPEIEKIFKYSCFDDSAQQTIIASDMFGSYDDILTLGDSDIVYLENILFDRDVALGKIRFGLKHTNLLKATIHWSKDLWRISQTPSLIGISNVDEFRAVI